MGEEHNSQLNEEGKKNHSVPINRWQSVYENCMSVKVV